MMAKLHRSITRKKQGQSTTEYLLVVLLASVFVGVFALQFSPVKHMVDRLQQRVTMAIAGGKLLTHPPRVAEETSSPPVAGQWQTAQAKAPQEKPAAGGDAGAPRVSSGGAREGESGFLDETGSAAAGGGTARVGMQKPSEETPADAVAAKVPTVPEEGMTQEKSEAKTPSETKEEDTFSKKGVRFGAGQEEEVAGKDHFNWMRLLLILLIALLLIYIVFEIVKTLKLSRSSRYR